MLFVCDAVLAFHKLPCETYVDLLCDTGDVLLPTLSLSLSFHL